MKDTTETTVRVELHSSVKTISVDINRVALVGGGGEGVGGHERRVTKELPVVW